MYNHEMCKALNENAEKNDCINTCSPIQSGVQNLESRSILLNDNVEPDQTTLSGTRFI